MSYPVDRRPIRPIQRLFFKDDGRPNNINLILRIEVVTRATQMFFTTLNPVHATVLFGYQTLYHINQKKLMTSLYKQLKTRFKIQLTEAQQLAIQKLGLLPIQAIIGYALSMSLPAFIMYLGLSTITDRSMDILFCGLRSIEQIISPDPF